MVQLTLPVLSCEATLPCTVKQLSISPLEEAAFQSRGIVITAYAAPCEPWLQGRFAANTSDYIPGMLNRSANGVLLDKLTSSVFMLC